MNHQFDEPTKSLGQAVTPYTGVMNIHANLAGLTMGAVLFAHATLAAPQMPTPRSDSAFSWPEIGAKAGADYQGDGLAITPTESGARLRCVFQRLEGEATREGLWLTSTVTKAVSDRFRVTAAEVGRVTPCAPGQMNKTPNIQHPTSNIQLENAGTVEVADKVVRFLRPGVIEEYSVSIDGVRQDFIIEQRPEGAGELVVRLDVSGAQIEPLGNGARFVLESSGRKIAYSRLRAMDATGKELTARMEVARMEVPAKSKIRSPKSEIILAVLVNDSYAVYPVRIDPTFSDANWSSMGGLPGASGVVNAAVMDGPGNLYIGGAFTMVGDVFANGVAKWNGSSWSALGSGIDGLDGGVNALAVSASDLYAGGSFTTAGGKVSAYIARAYLSTLPTLSVLRSSTNVMVSWPSADTASFALEQAGTLVPPVNWVTNTASITDDGINKSVTLPPTNNSQFFRLHRP